MYMYKLACHEIGFDCSFSVKDNDKGTIANKFSKHLLINHDQYYPKKEVFGFIEQQNTKNFEKDETVNSNKWFQGRRNFS